MVTKNMLAQARKQQEEFLPDTVTIYRYDTGPDDYGGATQDWQVIYTNVPARMMRPRLVAGGGQETTSAARLTETESWNLTMPHGQDIDQRDRVQHQGIMYEVIGINIGASYHTATRANLRRVG